MCGHCRSTIPSKEDHEAGGGRTPVLRVSGMGWGWGVAGMWNCADPFTISLCTFLTCGLCRLNPRAIPSLAVLRSGLLII